MSKDERDLTYWQKLKMAYRLHAPWKDPSDIAKAAPDEKNYGPWAWVGDGMPHYYPQKMMIAAGFFLAVLMFFVNEAAVGGRIIISVQYLFAVNVLGFSGAGMAAIAMIQFLYDSHRGTFDTFEQIWEPWRVFDLDGHMRQDINRVYKNTQIWEPSEGLVDEEVALREEVPA